MKPLSVIVLIFLIGCTAPTADKVYVRTAPEECTVNFLCPEGKVPFLDETGCGCKDEEKNFCTEEQKGALVCGLEEDTVCGWFSENIKCIAFPCAATFNNPCMACTDENVAYWTDGECPTPASQCAQPQTSYEDALKLLFEGQAKGVFQTHALCVDLELKDGTIIHTKEPVIDDLFKKLEECGESCQDMTLATE
jgi:hypothetical protein